MDREERKEEQERADDEEPNPQERVARGDGEPADEERDAEEDQEGTSAGHLRAIRGTDVKVSRRAAEFASQLVLMQLVLIIVQIT